MCVNIIETCCWGFVWQCVNIGSEKALVPLGSKPLSEIMLTEFHEAIWLSLSLNHYNDVIMSTMASQITGVSIACSTVGSGEDQTKHQSSASLAFARGIHRWPVNSPHDWPVTRKMFPFDDVIMELGAHTLQFYIETDKIFLYVFTGNTWHHQRNQRTCSTRT